MLKYKLDYIGKVKMNFSKHVKENEGAEALADNKNLGNLTMLD